MVYKLNLNILTYLFISNLILLFILTVHMYWVLGLYSYVFIYLFKLIKFCCINLLNCYQAYEEHLTSVEMEGNYIYIYYSFFMNGSYLVLMLTSILLILSILLSVAFYTLGERKVMGSIQRRRGPQKIGLYGVLQPIADGLKLLLKEIIVPYSANRVLFLIAPLLTFFLSFLVWCVIPWSNSIIYSDFNLSILYILGISSLNIYGLILAGWSSNSKYAFLGALRSTAQMISYEIVLSFTILVVVLCSGTYNLVEISLYQQHKWLCVSLWPMVILFMVTMLAETNRVPFDLPEAESELVAGYNTEYSSITFAMFFLGEYASMLLMCSLVVLLFFGGWFFFGFGHYIFLFIKVIFFAFFFIWVRATLPRYRYDQLMMFSWKFLLIFVFGYFLFILGILRFFDGLVFNFIFI